MTYRKRVSRGGKADAASDAAEPRPTTRRRFRLGDGNAVKIGANGAEHRRDVLAENCRAARHDEGDQADEQAVFDHRRTFLVPAEASEHRWENVLKHTEHGETTWKSWRNDAQRESRLYTYQ